jgi:hypothetical protein
MPASNHTFACEVVDGVTRIQAVYKPVSGERPLWDFTDGTLAFREYAAWVVSDALGWDVVPPTVLRNGPAGSGMVQLWCEPDGGVDPVDIVPEDAVPDGYLHVLDAVDDRDRPVALVHEDTRPLRRMAIFDVVVNNTDRKGGHVLAMADGHRFGVDHGVCFHTDDKLRTVCGAGPATRSPTRRPLLSRHSSGTWSAARCARTWSRCSPSARSTVRRGGAAGCSPTGSCRSRAAAGRPSRGRRSEGTP